MNRMHQILIYWNWYKRLLINNLLISLLFSLLNLEFFLKTFGLVFMTAGFLISLVYQELTYKSEYYFYHNLGLSKLRLIAITEFINILVGITSIIIYYAIASGG